MTSDQRIGAIILAGGRSSRMGADKAQVRVDGVRLVDALTASLDLPYVVVSPFDLGIPTVSEDPPFGGPVAGIAAGLAHLGTELIAVLAVDAPRSAAVIPLLASSLGSAADVAVVEDPDGRIQPLCALWRRDALEAALASIEVRDASVMQLLRAAQQVVAVPGDGSERDYDTPDDLAELGTVTL